MTSVSYVQQAGAAPQLVTRVAGPVAAMAAAQQAGQPSAQAALASAAPMLAHTGADSSALLWAVALLLFGALLLVAGRQGRRRNV